MGNKSIRALFCAHASPGFLFPLIGIARELRLAGWECPFVTGIAYDGLLKDEGFERVPRGAKDGASFDLPYWGIDVHIAMQKKHVEYALTFGKPDVIVTNQLALGPLMVAEEYDIPIVVLGLAAYLYPAKGNARTSESASRKEYTYFEMLRFYNHARAQLRMKPISATLENNPFLGDAFLLQSVRAFYENVDLPARVQYVGAALWEPENKGQAAQIQETDVPAYYVQPGRSFGKRDAWPNIIETLGQEPVKVYGSFARADGQFQIPGNFVAARHLPQNHIVPKVQGVMSSGHTTSVLGAALNGKPMILVPNGSGTHDITEVFVSLGAAVELNDEAVATDARVFYDAFHRFIADDDMRQNAERVRKLFGGANGCTQAALRIEALLDRSTVSANGCLG